MRVRVGRRYRRVKVKRGIVAYGGKSRWKGIRRPRVKRRAVMRVRCGGKLRKIYKRGRRLVMTRKGRKRRVRWGYFCSAADYWVLNPLSSWNEALGNFQCCLISFIIEGSFVLNGIASIVRNKKSQRREWRKSDNFVLHCNHGSWPSRAKRLKVNLEMYFKNVQDSFFALLVFFCTTFFCQVRWLH